MQLAHSIIGTFSVHLRIRDLFTGLVFLNPSRSSEAFISKPTFARSEYNWVYWLYLMATAASHTL